MLLLKQASSIDEIPKLYLIPFLQEELYDAQNLVHHYFKTILIRKPLQSVLNEQQDRLLNSIYY